MEFLQGSAAQRENRKMTDLLPPLIFEPGFLLYLAWVHVAIILCAAAAIIINRMEKGK